MTLRHCDICGRCSDAEAWEPGRGVLVVLKARPQSSPLEDLFQSGPRVSNEQHDFCPDCTRHLVRLMADQRISRL